MFRLQRTGDGAERQDIQVSANWETGHSVKMFRFQRTERRGTVSRCSGFSELGEGAQRQDVQVSANWETAHSVKMFRFQRTGRRRTASISSGFSEMGDGAQRQDVQDFSELGDGAQRQEVQVSANWGTAHSVNMFRLKRNGILRTASAYSFCSELKDGEQRQARVFCHLS